MIEALIKAIQEGTKAEVLTIDGNAYVTQDVHVPDPEPRVDRLYVHTLAGFVDYLTERAEELKNDQPFIHIQSPKQVALFGSPVGRHQLRNHYCQAEVLADPSFTYGKWYPLEDFTIALQAHFLPSDTRAAILALVGNLTDEASRTNEDDGVTQIVTVKKGLTRAARATVPNPVSLAPYRTFAEIDQPESPFVFRLQTGNGPSPTAALFKVDDTKWQLAAIASIKAFLADKVGKLKIIA